MADRIAFNYGLRAELHDKLNQLQAEKRRLKVENASRDQIIAINRRIDQVEQSLSGMEARQQQEGPSYV